MASSINALIFNVREISEKYNAEIIKSGIGFNLITILGMETNERYTHSAFLAELLSPRGRHGQNDLFLKHFIKICNIEGFNYKSHQNIHVETEKYVGEITVECDEKQYTSRTFLDIVITNSENGKSILIENKIYAPPQEYQLERYAKVEHHSLIYLTIDGVEYSPNNTNLKYVRLSYKENILKWIDECIKVVKPISEKQSLTIEMYKDIINKLTNQSIYKNMNDEIIKTILLNPENYEAARLITANLAQVKHDFERAKNEIRRIIEVNLEKRGFKMEDSIGKFNYKVEISEEDGESEVFLGFRINDYEINKDSQDVVRSTIINLLDNKYLKNPHSTEYWPIWFNPNEDSVLENGVITFENLTAMQIKCLTNDSEKEARVISDYFIEILETLKSRLVQ